MSKGAVTYERLECPSTRCRAFAGSGSTPAQDTYWLPLAAEVDPEPDWRHARDRVRIVARAEALSLGGLPALVGDTLVHHEHVDVFLATLLGYFARAGRQPSPASSPYLRRHQTWYADVVADWLAHRRGW